MPIPIIPSRFAPRTTVPGTNTNSNYTVPQAINNARQSYTYRPKNMGDIAAERAVRNRQQRTNYDRVHGQGTYNAQQSNKNTQMDILKSKQEDTLAQMAGGAANGIDTAMGIVSMIPGANLAGDTYFAMKGAKDLNQGNYLDAALNTLPIGASVLGKGLDVATPYIKTGLENLSNMFGAGVDRASQLYKPFREYRIGKLLGEPKLTSEFTKVPDNSFSYMYPDMRFNVGQYFNTTNPHTIVSSGLKPLNNKSTYFFQADTPGSYYYNMVQKARDDSKYLDTSTKIGLHFNQTSKLNNHELLDFLTDGSQDVKDTPWNKLLQGYLKNYFTSDNYKKAFMQSKYKDSYDKFINGFVFPAFNNYSYRNVSPRLMSKISETKPGYTTFGMHTSLSNSVGNGYNLFNDVTRRTVPAGTQTYFHEVGGHGTEEAFGINKVKDPTNISQKFLQQTSSQPSSNSGFQNYLQQPNEMRARGISTNALRTSLPGFSNRYFKINSDGEIQNIPKRSQLEKLTQSLNGNKDVSLSYLDNIFKQGGKI